MENIRKKLLIQMAKIHGMRCSKCGKRMVDYNKLSRYLDRENAHMGFHSKDMDGLCYICKNPTCPEYEKPQLTDI